MIALPQHGGCICGDVRYTLREDPVTVYACHCTDCQTDSGSTCLLAVVVRSVSFEFTAKAPESRRVTLADGREWGGYRCPRCQGPIGSVPRGDGIQSIDGGTFDDTSWTPCSRYVARRGRTSVPQGSRARLRDNFGHARVSRLTPAPRASVDQASQALSACRSRGPDVPRTLRVQSLAAGPGARD